MNLYKHEMLCVTCSYTTQAPPLGPEQEASYTLRLGKGTGGDGQTGEEGALMGLVMFGLIWPF